MTGAQILWEALVREGVTDVFGYPGGAILPAYDAMLGYPDPPRPGPPRAGRDAHGGRLRARERQGRRRDCDVGPGRDQHGHRHRHGDDGLVADRLHHRPGRQQADRLRRVPGNRHHRHHAADHEAQLPGDARRRHRAGDARGVRRRRSRAARARCWSTSPRTRSTSSCEVDWDAAEPHLHRGARRRAAGRRRRRRGARADQRGRAAADSRRPRHHAVGRRARDPRARREGADPGRRDAARHRRRARRRIRSTSA